MQNTMAFERPEVPQKDDRPAHKRGGKKFVQTTPGSPAIPVETWKKMTEEEREKIGEERWREQK